MFMPLRGRAGRTAAPLRKSTTPAPPKTAIADKLINQLMAPEKASPGNAAPGGIGAEAQPGLRGRSRASSDA